MTCPKCNHNIPNDSEFCQYCGSKIETSSIESDDNKADVKEEPITEEVIVPTTDNETAAQILASGIIEGQKAMEANKECQPHNELDADFGLVPHKPVYTVGIDEQEKYLKSLRTINDEPIKWNLRGSMSVDGVNGMVDVYDTFLPSGEEYKTIYINMHGASNSTFSPKGFSYSDQPTASLIVPTSKHKSKKSKGLKIALIATGILTIVAVLFFVFAMPEINYQRANTLFNEDKYDAALLRFKDLGNYRDSEDMVTECKYQKACSIMGIIDKDLWYVLARDRAQDAIDLFESLNGYKNSDENIIEVKYRYALYNHYIVFDDGEIYYRNGDTTLFDYLKELKSIDYKDSANLYKKLYDWKVEVVAINSSEDDKTTKKEEIDAGLPIYFHIELSGGEPNASVRISVKGSFPSGNPGDYTFEEKWSDGSSGWYGWTNGLSTAGMLRCYFYDEDGNIIGGDSVEIINEKYFCISPLCNNEVATKGTYCSEHKCANITCSYSKGNNSNYCSVCACMHTGCKNIKKQSSYYCYEHACMSNGCSLEREYGSIYCYYHSRY